MVLTWGLVAGAAAVFILAKDAGEDPSNNVVGPVPPSTAAQAREDPGVQVEAVAFGVTTPSGPYNLEELDAFQAAAGKAPGVLMFSQDWASGGFRPELFEAIRRRGLLPMVTWEPRNHQQQGGRDGSPNQPEYALARILSGEADAYITEWAKGVRQLGYPIAIRFAQQMNGSWFPWAETANGNRSGEYVATWKHVRNIFKAVGVTNAIWVWSPNISYSGSAPLAGLYPGDEYVDWIGLDGYNGGSELPWGGWLSAEQIFLPTIQEVRSFTQKPLMLTEVASSEAGGNKAEWISAFFRMLEQHREIQGFVWVEANREADWRIVSSPAAKAAFSAAVAGPQFRPGLPGRLLPAPR